MQAKHIDTQGQDGKKEEGRGEVREESATKDCGWPHRMIKQGFVQVFFKGAGPHVKGNSAFPKDFRSPRRGAGKEEAPLALDLRCNVGQHSR